MKNKMKLSIFFFFIFLTLALNAQENNLEKDEIKAILKVQDGNIILRWAPGSTKLWLKWPYGYVTIHKKEWIPGQLDMKEHPTLVSDTLRVWTREKYASIVDTPEEDVHTLLCAYAIYEPYETVSDTLSLAEMVERRDELINRYSSVLFAVERSRKAARSVAMLWEDNNPNLNNRIVYTVRFHTADGQSYYANAYYDPEKNYDFTPVLKQGYEGEGMVTLSWDRRLHEAHYSAYWIERSDDGRSFERLTESPYVHAFDVNSNSREDDFVFFDSVTNYIPHYYRIIGLDAFGDESKPSNVLKLMGRDRTAPQIPQNIKAIMPNQDYMQITWEHAAIEQDLVGFIIYKDYKADGNFQKRTKLLDKNVRDYKDLDPFYMDKNYYRVCAIDTAGNQACSRPKYGFINDTIPPSKPLGLQGAIDSSGVVSLHWNLGKERDIAGYNIYFSNHRNGVFNILNSAPVADTSFRDTVTLKTLTKDIYYSIVAVDARSNMSPFSDKIKIQKPDTIPPTAPVFNHYECTDSSIVLRWAASSSKDIAYYELWRKIDHSDFELLYTPVKDETTYIDTSLNPISRYTYRIIAVDDSGLKANCPKDLSVKSGTLTPDYSLILEMQNDSLNYSIHWKTDCPPNKLNKIVILKSTNQGPYLTWKTMTKPKGTINLSSKNVNKNRYKARLYLVNGIKTDYSNVVALK